MDSIQDSLSQLQQMFVQKMDIYQNELQTASSQSNNLSALTAEFHSFRKFIMSAIQSLQDQVALLTHQTDNLEMKTRRKILLIHGIPETKNEDTITELVKVLGNKLKMPEITTTDICRCHRMGRNAGAERPRPILFKTRDFELRSKIWQAKTRLKGTGTTLSEFLTKSRHEALIAARQKYGVTKCWSRDGQVFVLGANGERHRVSSLADLEKMPSIELPKPAVVRHEVMKETVVPSKSRRAAVMKK